MAWLFVVFISGAFLSFAIKGHSYLKDSGKLTEYGFIGIILISVGILYFLFKYFISITSSSLSKLKTIYILMLIVSISAFPKLLFIYAINTTPVSDFSLYHNLAKSFAEGVWRYPDKYIPNFPEIYPNFYISLFPHVFGYPTILSMVYAIFGYQYPVAQLFNVFIGSVIAILIYFTGREIKNGKTGFIASIIWCLWPSQIAYVSLISTELIFSVFILTVLYLFIMLAKDSTKGFIPVVSIIIMIALIVVANSIRPIGTIIMIAITIYYFLFVKMTNYKIRDWSKKIMLVLLVFVLYYCGTRTVNYFISNTIHIKTANTAIGYNLLVGSNHSSEGGWNASDFSMLNKLKTNSMDNAQQVHNTLLGMGIERIKSASLSKNLNLLMNKFHNVWATDADCIYFINESIDPKEACKFYINKHIARQAARSQ